MDTPGCVATYEAGHSDCDGDVSGGACRLRKPCIELRKFCLAEKYEPSKLASALSLKEIKAFYAGRLELRIVSGRFGKQLYKSLKQQRAKSTPVFGKKHWRLYYEFERAMCEYFQRYRVANRLAPELRRVTKARVSTYRRKAAMRTGALYPVARTRERGIEWIRWCCTSDRNVELRLVEIKPLNKPSRLWIRMQFPIAELELRAAPEMISELGLKASMRIGISQRKQAFFILRTASVQLIKLSVYALKIMIDSGYMGVPEFGALNVEGGQ